VVWYFLALGWVYFLIYRLRFIPLALLGFCAMPLVMFATFRGSSGKDSELYLHRFYSFDSDGYVFNFFDEPVLNFLIYVSRSVSDSHELFYFLHAIIVCTLFCLALKRFDSGRLYFFSVAPMFLVDGLTNGMRVTLAYHFFLVAVVYRREILVFPAVFLSHVSGALLYITRMFPDYVGRSKARLLYVIPFFAFAGVAIYMGVEYLSALSPRISGKLSKYGGMVLATKYSGIADITVLFSLFVCVALGPVSYLKRFFYVLSGLVCCLAFYFLIQQSLAFIRILKLVLLGLMLSGTFVMGCSKGKEWVVVVVGYLYTLNFVRQILTDPGFLPYPGEL